MRDPCTLGRPREFDEDEALTAIMEVFWAKGFDGTSLSDLMEATGLKKGSLYAAFGDKRAMYLKALALYDRIWIDRAAGRLSGEGEPLSRIEAFLQAASSNADGRGCFLCNAAIDQASGDPGTGRLVQASLGRLETALAGAIMESAVADDRSLASADDARRNASHLMSVYFGLRVLARSGASKAMMDDARSVALAVLAA